MVRCRFMCFTAYLLGFSGANALLYKKRCFPIEVADDIS